VEHGQRLELSRFSHVHFLGIGGIGVSAVARLVMAAGARVSGSDVRESSITQALARDGARVFIGHAASNLDGADLIVVSTAIPDTNPELRAAHEAGLPVVHRARVLDALMAGRHTIGVTGTNGKGSVSSMIAWLLDRAGRTPAFAIGARLLDFDTNARPSDTPLFVAELDESDGSVVHTHPDRLVLVNLEADHLNHYKDLDGLLDTFAAYLADPDAPPAIHGFADDANVAAVLRRAGRAPVTFGTSPDATYRVSELAMRGMGSTFRLSGPGGDLGTFALSLPGAYNAMNAAAALSVVLEEGVAPDVARAALPAFRGLENRFTVVPVGPGFVVKDYTSHPNGIRAVIDGARAFAKGRIVTVFKPYRFTMIHYLHNEYREAFRGADLSVITEMYTAGEVPIPGIDTTWLIGRIRDAGATVIHVPDMDGIVPALLDAVHPDDTVIFFGGDDLFRLADGYVARRRAAAPTEAP
jgi:UDP-N-acetylmuramate--alanine ligase